MEKSDLEAIAHRRSDLRWRKRSHVKGNNYRLKELVIGGEFLV